MGVIGADVCINPSALITSFVSEDNLNYFLTCATNPLVPPAPVLGMLNGAINTVTGGVSQLTAITTQVNNNLASPAGYGPLIIGGAINTNFNDAAKSLNSAVFSLQAIPNTVLSCQQVDAMFSRLWEGLCNGTITSALGIAQVLIAAGVFMLLQMAVGIDLCCYHPGDSKAWVDGGNVGSSKVASSVASVPNFAVMAEAEPAAAAAAAAAHHAEAAAHSEHHTAPHHNHGAVAHQGPEKPHHEAHVVQHGGHNSAV